MEGRRQDPQSHQLSEWAEGCLSITASLWKWELIFCQVNKLKCPMKGLSECQHWYMGWGEQEWERRTWSEEKDFSFWQKHVDSLSCIKQLCLLKGSWLPRKPSLPNAQTNSPLSLCAQPEGYTRNGREEAGGGGGRMASGSSCSTQHQLWNHSLSVRTHSPHCRLAQRTEM